MSKPGRVRRGALTVLAAIAALLTALLTVGAFEKMLAADSSSGDRFAALPHAPWLALGWSAAFLALVWRAQHHPAGLQQVLAMLVGLYVGGTLLAPGEDDWVFVIGFGVVAAGLVALYPDRRSLLRAGPAGPSPLMLPFVLLAAVPLTIYAFDVMDLYVGPTQGPFYLGVAATATSAPLVGLVAGLRSAGMRLPTWSAGVMAASLGIASLLWASDPGAMPMWAALLTLAGSAGFVALGEWERARASRTPTPGSVPASDADRQVAAER
ncbi:MAG: hypothetical protein ACR2FV_16985 [Ornithinimicrobium sp.]|uniref:hypothetical protein n=1 Tax=Ornithinimicrobium sp. TaxID=1977084 RepID=UPI003D9B8E56